MIGRATDIDLDYIKEWLRAEHAKFGKGFWVNWSIIERTHYEGDLIVLREQSNAVAFHTEGETLNRNSVLAVHPEKRGQGLGTTLASYIISKARNADEVVLEIECAPDTSKPFWNSLGFQLMPDDFFGYGSDFAYLPLEKTLMLPTDGTSVSVTVRYFDDHSPRLLQQYQLQGRRLNDGTIALERRVIGFSKPTSSDVGVEIDIDGQPFLRRNRAKYLEAFGFVRTDNAFYLDSIKPVGPGSRFTLS